MYRFIQFDAVTGSHVGSLSSVELDREGVPVPPPGRVIIDSAQRPEAITAIAYDAATDTFTQPTAAAPRQPMLSKADVIEAIQPAMWAELNQFHPTATGTHAGGTPYNDQEVFWAVSVFNSAAKDFALNDRRLGNLLGRFVAKNIMTAQERQTLIAALTDVAK